MRTVSWLSPQAQEWVDLYGYFLEGVWARFESDGEWPDPIEVQRELRAVDRSRRVTQALDRMPPLFARREHVPPRLALTIFGLGCCEGARLLLEQYLAVAKLALERFDSPTLPNRLCREDVVSEFDLSPVEADRLSVVLGQYAPFLGGGEISIEKWDRAIDPQAEEFEGVEDIGDLLEVLARKQRLTEPLPSSLAIPVPVASEAIGSVPSGGVSSYEKLMLGAAVISAIATMISLGLTLASSPSVVALSLVGLFAGLTAALLIARRPLPGVMLVLLFTLIGGGAGAVLMSPEGPFHYFVASTGKADALIPLIEPHPGAAMARDTVLISGSPVQVACLDSSEGTEWAKLADGTFVRAELLAPEVGGDAAPNC